MEAGGHSAAASAASSVAQAIATTTDGRCSPDSRMAAFSFLESFKNADIHLLASTSIILIGKGWPSDIRLHGFKMLQHLVRIRWDEFSATERRDFAKITINLTSEMVDPCEEWALKSQTAALIAEVVRQEGLTLLRELLPSMVSLSNRGPVEAGLVSMVLRWLPEDITVHNEDLDGDRRRTLLRGLTESLPEVFPLLYNLLETHCGAAITEASRQQLDKAKEHAATVTATLNAINSYAEWAPVSDLAKYGIIHGCSFLLSSVDFRPYACEFFKLVCQRRRPVDADFEFDSVMSTVFQILMDISGNFLKRSFYGTSTIDESEIEFMEGICGSMVALGISHIQCIIVNCELTSQFLLQMIEYFRHYSLVLHFDALHFWLKVVMREFMSKGKISTQTIGDISSGSGLSGLTERERKDLAVMVLISDEMLASILDMSFQRMLKRNPESGVSDSPSSLELWSEDFDTKIDFGQYRSKLLELIRLATFQRPIVAAVTICKRIEPILMSALHTPISAQGVALMESMQLGLEAVIGAVYDGQTDSTSNSSETKLKLQNILEGFLHQLLSLKWTEPSLAILLGRYLDSLGPYSKYNPAAVKAIITKLFELLTSLPLTKEPNNARHARLQICSSFIRIARTADISLLPHMKDIADTMACLEREGRLLRSERNLLCESFLIMASSSGIQQQQDVLAWLLEPLNQQWTQVEWQNVYLSDPSGIIRLFSDTQFMWSIFHTVTFFEKALKRSGFKKGLPESDICNHAHPMSSHINWMLPPLLRLLRAIHSMFSQPGDQALTGELRAMKCMSHAEQSCLLGEGNLRPTKGQLTFSDSQIDKDGEFGEIDVRNWLKGIRDSGYNVVGLSTTIGDTFFRCLDCSSVVLSLVENVRTMEYRHLRQLIHLVIGPLVKHCPADSWEAWLETLLHQLFLHCQQALTCSWSSLLHEGRAKVPDTFARLAGFDLKVEVMEEKLLRDLTREVCSLLSIISSSPLNRGLPSLEHLGHANRMGMSLKGIDAFASNSMVGFLIGHKGPAIPVLTLILQIFSWSDSEAVGKVIPFCGAVILIAVSTDNLELRGFVAKDMFYAIIQGLSLESNAIISADLVGLCREIFIFLADRDPAPRQILLSLPCITSEDLIAFEDALNKTTSSKEQKQHMKALLQLATGNKLKAIAAQKSTNVITNVTTRSRAPAAPGGGNTEEDVSIGLAAIT